LSAAPAERQGAVIVTGASAGIGKATAKLLAERGYDLGITYRSGAAAADALVSEIRALGRRAYAIQLDLDDPSAAEGVVRELEDRLGGLTGLVNNAATDHRSPFLADDLAAWEHVLRVDLLGAVIAARTAAQLMVARRAHGAIVNVTSVLDRLPVAGGAAYCAAKAALSLASEVMALELCAHGIRVNTIAPGHTSTPQNFGPQEIDPRGGEYPEIPAGRPAQAREIAQAIAYLLGEDASYVTGSRLLVDGGLTLISGPQTLETSISYTPSEQQRRLSSSDERGAGE
jgi:NAD(P)-dependent dehydrogenase (short-subunit alcohol dehydrogenase family)